jgi:hypothetical protein
MPITPTLISRHLSGLVGRPVSVVRADRPTFLPAIIFGCYDVKACGAPAVIKIDLALLASLSGVMMGIPSTAVEAQVKANKLDELLDDAAKEIMNVMAAIFQERRMLFKGLYTSPIQYSDAAEKLMGAITNTVVNVTIPGYKGGCMSLADGC